MKKKKTNLPKRVEALEAQVRWLMWLTGQHCYQESVPQWYIPYPKPDSSAGGNFS